MGRKFGGKKFLEHDFYGSIRSAKNVANRLRNSGWLARIVKEGRAHVVYKRRK